MRPTLTTCTPAIRTRHGSGGRGEGVRVAPRTVHRRFGSSRTRAGPYLMTTRAGCAPPPSSTAWHHMSGGPYRRYELCSATTARCLSLFHLCHAARQGDQPTESLAVTSDDFQMVRRIPAARRMAGPRGRTDTRRYADARQPVVHGCSFSGLSIAQMWLIRSPATSNAITTTVTPSS